MCIAKVDGILYDHIRAIVSNGAYAALGFGFLASRSSVGGLSRAAGDHVWLQLG